MQTPGRVLSIDDSPIVRAMVSLYLRSGGYEVHEAGSGAEALRHLASGGYDVVITDLHMPDLDGFAVLSAVKDVAPHTEVVVLTGAHDVNFVIRALRLGAHDYLTKPLTNADGIIHSVQRAVEKKRLHEKDLRSLRHLEATCRIDRVTGLPDRMAFEEAFRRETALAQRHAYPLSVVLLGIDFFPEADTPGPRDRGETLRSVSLALARNLRAADALYCYGDESFAAILPQTDLAGAHLAADRLVEAVTGLSVTIGSAQVSLTPTTPVPRLPFGSQPGMAA